MQIEIENGTIMPTAPVAAQPQRTDRITRWILIAIGIYTCLLVSLLNVFLLGSGKVIDRAIILMADGLILFWIVIGGQIQVAKARSRFPSSVPGRVPA